MRKRRLTFGREFQIFRSKIVCGMDGLLEIASFPESDVVVTAVVGMIGIRPTIAAIESGKTIALANKRNIGDSRTYHHAAGRSKKGSDFAGRQ